MLHILFMNNFYCVFVVSMSVGRQTNNIGKKCFLSEKESRDTPPSN